MLSIKAEPEDAPSWEDRSIGSNIQERRGIVSKDTGIDDIAVHITVHVKDEDALTDKTENEIAVDVELGNEDCEEAHIHPLYACPAQLSVYSHPTSVMETSSSVNKGLWAPFSQVIVKDDPYVHLDSSQQVEGPTGERQRSSVYQVSREEKQHTNEHGIKDYESQLPENSERNLESICTHANSCNCDICLTSFSLKNACNQNQVIQAGEKSFKCQYCEMTYKWKHSRKVHERTHTGEKPFKCQFCEKLFTQKHHCKSHEMTHTGEKPFKCQFCEKLFAQKHQCKTHEMTHTGEKPFKCQYCEKLFTQKHRCKTHEMTHTGEKPFKCQFCEKSFSWKQNRRIHEKNHVSENEMTHTSEKSFKCQFCGKPFARKHNCKRHEMTHSHTDEKPCTKSFVWKPCQTSNDPLS